LHFHLIVSHEEGNSTPGRSPNGGDLFEATLNRKKTDANFAGRAPQLGLKSMINWSKFLIEFSGPAGEMDVSAGAQAAGAAEQVEATFHAASSELGTYTKDYMEIGRIEDDDCIMNMALEDQTQLGCPGLAVLTGGPGPGAAAVVTASMMTEETVENSSIFLADSPSPLFWPVSDTSMAVESGDYEPRSRAAGDSESGRAVAGPCRAAGPAAGPEPLSRLVDSDLGFQVSDSAAGSGPEPEPLSRLADSDLPVGFQVSESQADSVAGSPEGSWGTSRKVITRRVVITAIICASPAAPAGCRALGPRLPSGTESFRHLDRDSDKNLSMTGQHWKETLC
jgi:hypothetical protein